MNKGLSFFGHCQFLAILQLIIVVTGSIPGFCNGYFVLSPIPTTSIQHSSHYSSYQQRHVQIRCNHLLNLQKQQPQSHSNHHLLLVQGSTKSDNNDNIRQDDTVHDRSDIEIYTENHPIISNVKHFLTKVFLLSILFVPIILLSTVTSSSSVCNAAPPYAVIAEELGYFPIMVPSKTDPNKNVVQYVSKRVQRTSTQQAIDLAYYIRNTNNNEQHQQLKVIMAGTYWCSHTSHQKELFGKEAWNILNEPSPSLPSLQQKRATSSLSSSFQYIECAPQGYRSQPTVCSNLQIDGYPTWIITRTTTPTTINMNTEDNTDDSIRQKQKSTTTTTRLVGERSLLDIATSLGYPSSFDPTIEESYNPPTMTGSGACK